MYRCSSLRAVFLVLKFKNIQSHPRFWLYIYSTVLSQLVYSLGGSGFAGANGSVMIEVVVRIFYPLVGMANNEIPYRSAFLPYPSNRYCPTNR